MNRTEVFEEFVKYYQPNFKNVDCYSLEFCLGVVCVDCKINNTCSSKSTTLIPRISLQTYEEFKKTNPEYFI